MIEFIDRIHDGSRFRVKDKEKAIVYQKICQNPGITRKQIIKQLKLRPTSVSNIVTELIDQHLVYDGSLQNHGKKGRPEVHVYANFDKFVVISLYVVSKQVKGVLFNIKQEVLAESAVRVAWDVSNDDLMNIISDIVEALKSHVPALSELLGVGISFLGNVNHVTKELRFSTRWRNIRNFSFEKLEKRLEQEVVVYTSLEAQMEYMLINQPDYRTGGILLYHWGYGVGASFACDGAILRSASGGIMEIGHTMYDPNSVKECVCGQVGCLETECAIWALIDKLDAPPAQIPEEEDAFQIYFQEHNLKTNDVIKKAAKVAAYGLNTLYKVLFPSHIIIESSFLADEELYAYFLDEFRSRVPTYIAEDIQIDRLETGYRGEIFGCTYSLFVKRFIKELTAF